MNCNLDSTSWMTFLRHGLSAPCIPLRGSITSVAIGILLCSALIWSVSATAQEKKITAVTVRNVPADERGYYLGTLKQWEFEAVNQFLKGLRLTEDQIANEMAAVDVQSLAGKCLDQDTLLDIYQALHGTCTKVGRDDYFDFISTIVLPKFNKDASAVATAFFPYGLSRLNVANSSLDYVDKYPELSQRETFETLIVLGFLNAYWEHVKGKATLGDVEMLILYSGFGQYGEKLRKLCPTLSTQQARCVTIANETSQLALKAKEKQ
jgi:hypothetical protein